MSRRGGRRDATDGGRVASRRLVVAAVAAAVLVAVPAVALATGSFTDVLPGSTHHDDVMRLSEADLVRGCAPGEFCPEDPLRRDQMAALLSRSLPAGGFDDGPAVLDADSGHAGVAAVAEVDTTGTGQGGSTVLVHGSVTVFTDEDVTGACPCEIEAFVYRDGGEQGPSSWAQLPAEPTPSGRVQVALPVTWTAQVPSGSREAFGLGVFVNDGAVDQVHAEGSLSVITTPFGEAPQG